jgi:methylase of polypeptide subunit release factors
MNYISWHAEDYTRKAHHISQMIDRNNISFHTAMEVGSGSGPILNAHSSRYDNERCPFDESDISPQAIAMAKQNENLICE